MLCHYFIGICELSYVDAVNGHFKRCARTYIVIDFPSSFLYFIIALQWRIKVMDTVDPLKNLSADNLAITKAATIPLARHKARLPLLN
jgi:hypothetical protein